MTSPPRTARQRLRPPPAYPRLTALHCAQKGFVLIYTLIALSVILIAGAALVRSMDANLQQAGNLAYQSDLVNFAQRGVAAARASLSTGSLNTDTLRQSNLPSANYSASRLPSNDQGIPTALLDTDANFAAVGTATDITDSATGVKLRFVIDRQCGATGDYSTQSCVLKTNTSESMADDRYRRVNGEGRPVYRITVRATGPRNSLAFFQAMVSL